MDNTRTTKFFWKNVIIIKHKELEKLESEIKLCLAYSDVVELSKEDQNVYIYYKKTKNKYICVVTKHLNEHGFIITAHIASKLRKGKIVWQKNRKK